MERKRFFLCCRQIADGINTQPFQLSLRSSTYQKQLPHRKVPKFLRHFLWKQGMYFVRFFKVGCHFCKQMIYGNSDVYGKCRDLQQ